MFLYAEAGTYKKISYKRRDIVMNVDLEGVIRIFCLISGVSAIITGILRIIFSLSDERKRKNIIPAAVSIVMGILVIFLLPMFLMSMIFK